MDTIGNTNSVNEFLENAVGVLQCLNSEDINAMAVACAELRARGGRLFILGVGGSAGHASHATNDFRKICGMECYCPTDNVSELTARVNDEGWDSFFESYLETSRLSQNDGLLIFSVGGGNDQRKISVGLIRAIKMAKGKGSKILSITGKSEGYAQANADLNICLLPKKESLVTPISEGLASVIWHALVSHPALQKNATTW